MFLKNLFKPKKKIASQKVSVEFHPDKIIVATLDSLDVGITVITDKLTILPQNISDQVLGQTLLSHLLLSEHRREKTIDHKKNYELFLKAGNFKTQKSATEFAQHIDIREVNGSLEITPYLNINPGRKNQYSTPIKDQKIIIPKTAPVDKIGNLLKEQREKCDFK